MFTEVRELQSLKVPSSIVVTLFGMVTEVRELQLQKANSPIVVTLLGMVTEKCHCLECKTVVGFQDFFLT